MSTQAEVQKTALLAEVEAHIAEKTAATQKAVAKRFAGKYCNEVDAEDFIARPSDAWAALSLSHLAFGNAFAPGAPKMRVFNPSVAEHGWDAACTVIEFVNDDMPFLVDSIAMEINRQGIAIQLLLHPLFDATRDSAGVLTKLDDAKGGTHLESWIHVEIEKITDAARIASLSAGIASVLRDVRAAVEDFPAMRAKPAEIASLQDSAACVVAAPELDEARAFLAWIADNHFTFLGYRDYELASDGGTDILRIVPKSGLGILREPQAGGISQSFTELPAALKALARLPQLLVLTKANSRATVHRPGNLDYIGIKRFDAKGNVIGEHRFIGLYTSSTYHANPHQIPLLRRKIAQVTSRAGFPPASHAGKNLFSILETFPRDELFQIGEDELFDTAIGILRLGERARTRMFVRKDIYGRFYSCFIYLPRENYNTETRLKLQQILMRAFNGVSVEFNAQVTEAALARVHLLIRTAPDNAAMPDLKALEAEVVAALRRWEDGVFQLVSLTPSLGEEVANHARREFVLPFPAAYREDVSAQRAVDDFTAARQLSADSPIGMSLYHAADEDTGTLRFRLIKLGHGVALSSSLPMLEYMGVKVESERSYVIARHHLPPLHIHDFGLRHSFAAFDIATVKAKFEAAFARIWKREVENDGFNRLTLAAALTSDEIMVLRAYAKYLKQTGFTFSQQYIEQTLAKHPTVARQLVHLFHARFDPAYPGERIGDERDAIAGIKAALTDVANADEDRILRRYLSVIQATLRTNHYQPDKLGFSKPYVSFKLDCAKVPELPEPRPLFEIFVYSPRFEGIHLRFGKVARGGLRWSDRPEDFRTEVLGLVKAQQVKNAVIVPVGSKGGFVLKSAPPASDRDAYLKEGVACYQNFLRGLLDLTDNIVQGKLTPPKRVVRHDADDAYLVVAADKGTATFSDYANAISAEYGHWLGDAFASGGSVGYDHKKMGITAKGAWESVKRHFREITDTRPNGFNVQTTDFTVVGVGDMSGDVFGNLMLLSKHIRLVAAFDHRHIFIDPAPDAAKSFKERARLFALPRSSWDDYNKTLVSSGGGVFSRDAKAIELSAEAKLALGIAASGNSMTPVELIRAILKAPVDLFYNGGIGTYVKASSQSNAEVGDRATDALRINGNELRCKVVAEGGNLGLTQLGRIEYALAGGRINSDAIDNSAGVDCSDHEVNIKILVGAIIDAGKLAEKDRNAFLAQMTEEVAQLVLKDNYFQTQTLAVSGVRAEKLLNAQARFIRAQEKAGRLNRAVEFLPSDDEINARKAKKIGLTAPERAVLLAYSKMALFDELLKSDLIDDQYVGDALNTYFPTALQQKYVMLMQKHALKREIIATEIANSTINRTGSVFVQRMQEEAGASAPEVVRSFILTRDIFLIGDLWQCVDALDGKIAASVQYDMLIEAGRLILRGTLWFLRRRTQKMPIGKVLEFFAPGVATVSHRLVEFLSTEDANALHEAEAALTARGVPADLASSVARLDAMYSVLDIVEISQDAEREVDLAATVYFSLVGKLNLRWLGGQISKLPSESHWQSMARAAMRDDLANLQRQLAHGVLLLSADLEEPQALIAAWEQHHDKALAHMREVMADLQLARESDLAMLSVMLRELRVLV